MKNFDKFDRAAAAFIPEIHAKNSRDQLAEHFRYHCQKNIVRHEFKRWDDYKYASYLWLAEICADRRDELAKLFRETI